MLEVEFNQNEKVENELVKQLRETVPASGAAVLPYHADSKSSKASCVIFKILFLVKTCLQLFLTHYLIQFFIKSHLIA